MDDSYKEVRGFKGTQPPSWKIKSLPKFNDVPGRKLNEYYSTKTNDGEPSTPPPSPMGAFKYPALNRGASVWPRTTSVDEIVTKFCKNTNHDMAAPSTTVGFSRGDKKQLQRPQTLQNCLIDIKPASGKTKMYLWLQSKSTNCSKLDLSSITNMDSAGPGQSLTSLVQGVSKASEISVLKKSKNSPEVGDTKKDSSAEEKTVMDTLKNCFSMMSTDDFDVILKHALSHDPVMIKHNFALRTQRSMTFAERPKAVFPIMKKAICDGKK